MGSMCVNFLWCPFGGSFYKWTKLGNELFKSRKLQEGQGHLMDSLILGCIIFCSAPTVTIAISFKHCDSKRGHFGAAKFIFKQKLPSLPASLMDPPLTNPRKQLWFSRDDQSLLLPFLTRIPLHTNWTQSSLKNCGFLLFNPWERWLWTRWKKVFLVCVSVQTRWMVNARYRRGKYWCWQPPG